MIWEDEVGCCDFLVELLIVGALEWETTTKECKEEHPGGINVSGWSTELLFQHDFRCHIRWCSAEKFYTLGVWDLSAETEVNEFDISVFIKHHIFKLYISMRNALRM